uniref:Serpentine receptor class gamma n=1 Tax=Steinernema glaseri TaxID=37863 RepID=A0A1I7Y4S9_9BILA
MCPPRHRLNRFYYTCLAIIWLLIFVHVGLSCTPLVHYIFYIDLSVATMDDSGKDYSKTFEEVKYYTTIVLLSFSFVLYVLMVCVLMHKRKSVTSNQELLARSEKKVLAQAVVIFFVCALDVAITFKAGDFIDMDSFEFMLLMLWVEVNFGFLNPVLYLGPKVYRIPEEVYRSSDIRQDFATTSGQLRV